VAASPEAHVAEGLGLVLLAGGQEARRLVHLRVAEHGGQHVRKVGGRGQDVALRGVMGQGRWENARVS
jgi:hypothetical protein